jgi:hypothetical protein
LEAWVVAGLCGGVLLGVDGAVCSKRLAILLEHVAVEKVDLVWVEAEPREDGGDEVGLHVDGVLGNSIRSAEKRVVWSRVEVSTNAGAWVVVSNVSITTLCRLLPSWRSDWGGSLDLGVSVGTSDDNVEVSSVLSIIDSSLLGNTRSPKCALVVGNRWWVGAFSSWVDAWVTLEVDVEGSAKVLVVAERSASSNVI